MSYAFDKFSHKFFTRNWLLIVMLLVLGQSSAFSQSVLLTWYSSTDTNAVGYKIYFGGASGIYTNSFVVGDATNVNVYGLTPGATYYFTATTMSASGKESPFSNEATYHIPGSQPPTLNTIGNLTVFKNSGQRTINLAGISAGTSGTGMVNVSAVSDDNGAIISAPAISYSSPNSTGSLSFTPVTGAVGTATVTVTVDNGGLSNNPVSQVFTVTVISAPPSLDPITNLIIVPTAGLQTVTLTGISPGNSGNSIVNVSAVSDDNGAIISAPAVFYTNSDSTGTLTFTPTGTFGTATVTVTVDNGGANNHLTSQTFTVLVADLPPTLDAITNLTIYESSGLRTISLTGITPGLTTPNSTVTVTAVSSNPGLIPNPTVNFSSSNNFGTLTFKPVVNTLGSATVTVTVNNGGSTNNLTTQVFTVTVVVPPGGNQPPTLNPIANVSFLEDTLSQNITLTGIGSGSPTERQTLRISAVSSNSRLIASALVRYISPSSTAVLTLRPALNAVGTATITVTLTDGGKSNNIVRQTFTVTLLPIQPPTLDAISNVTVAEKDPAQTITLTGISTGSLLGSQTLRVSATSSNPRVISTPVIHYTSPGSTATLTFKPSTTFIGTATVTVLVTDGNRVNNTVRQKFTVTVTPPNTNVVAEVKSAVSAEPNVGVSAPAILSAAAETDGVFSFQVTGTPGAQYTIQATTDMVHWTSVQTNTAPFTFQEGTVGGPGRQFYRAVSAQ